MKILGTALLILISTVFCGFVDQHLWNWFVATYFHLAHMPLWIAIGFGYIVCTNSKANVKSETELTYNETIELCLIIHTIMFVCGFITYHLCYRGI